MADVFPYTPRFYVDMRNILDVGSAWRGIDRILYDIVNRFNIPQKRCLEFGVQFGYSTSALANVFDEVIGVDTFVGDEHSGYRNDHFHETADRFNRFKNVQLMQVRYQDYIVFDELGKYDLIHIDIVHTFEDTYKAGLWAVEHAPVVIFHDTESFPDVRLAVQMIAEETGRKFYNYQPCHGLGILVKA